MHNLQETQLWWEELSFEKSVEPLSCWLLSDLRSARTASKILCSTSVAGVTLHATNGANAGDPRRLTCQTIVSAVFPTKAVAKITQAAGLCLRSAGKTLEEEWKLERRQWDKPSFISKVHLSLVTDCNAGTKNSPPVISLP